MRKDCATHATFTTYGTGRPQVWLIGPEFLANISTSHALLPLHNARIIKLSSLERDISPPRVSKCRKISTISSLNKFKYEEKENRQSVTEGPSLAAIKARQVKIQDHLEYFIEHLKKFSRPVL